MNSPTHYSLKSCLILDFPLASSYRVSNVNGQGFALSHFRLPLQ